MKITRRTLTVLCLGVATTALAPGSAVGRAPPPDAGSKARVDLDLHRSPFVTETARPAPGATLAPPRSSNRGSDAARYPLRPSPDGGYSYEGAVFDARIAPNGAVTFSSRSPLVRQADTRAPGRDPTTHGDSVAAGGGPTVRFDVTDQYLRRLRKDPTRDAKAAFLSGTFDLRMKMALAARDELRQAALERLPARLDELWRDPGLTTPDRQRILLATWQGLESGDAAARAIVGDFARRHLPPAKAAAFR